MTLDIATRTTTAPLAIGSRVIFRRDPHERVTVTGCEHVGDGWSVSWRAEPAVPGVRAAEGLCPAERLMPETSAWALACGTVGGQG
jgi:hypothetical protein